MDPYVNDVQRRLRFVLIFKEVYLNAADLSEMCIRDRNKSGHTRDNAFFSRKIVDEKGIEINTALIVCKAFHARRCLMLYQMAFPEANIIVSPVYCYNITKENWFETEQGINLSLIHISLTQWAAIMRPKRL